MGNHRLTYFTDCSLRYTARHIEIEWCCNNLFNKSQIDHIYLDNLTEQCIESYLRRQEFLMKLRFTF